MKRSCALYLLLFTLMLTGACKKRPFDYRNKYQGVWRFTYTYYKWSVYKGEAELLTDEFRGRVYYDPKEQKRDELLVEFSEEFTSVITLDKKGKFEGCGGKGEFKDRKSVSFEYISNGCSRTYSSGTSYTVSGKKEHSE